jgi:hypothetical protein
LNQILIIDATTTYDNMISIENVNESEQRHPILIALIDG